MKIIRNIFCVIGVLAVLGGLVYVGYYFGQHGNLGGAVSPNELLSMYERQQAITIEVAEPISQEQGTEKELDWEELAFLETYPEFREIFDDTIGVTVQGNTGKNGVIYADLEGNHTNNSTLRFAFANAKFLSKLWNNTENLKTVISAVKNTYTDITDDGMAKYAVINAYFNIFPDAEPNYFNGNQTLTRGEFLAGVYRAGNQVQDLQPDSYFNSLVDPAGMDSNAIFASQLQDYSYLTTEDNSLNSGTYTGVITRGEAVYTLVKLYYANEYNNTSGSESSYSDAKNGGDVALKAGFKVQDKETGATTVKDYWKSYELSYALQNPDKGMPSDLYRALVVAKNHGLIAGTTSDWDMGLTKSEAIKLITNVYQSLGTITSADRGASQGQVVVNNNPTITETPSTPTETPTNPGNTDTSSNDFAENNGAGEANNTAAEGNLIEDKNAFDKSNITVDGDSVTISTDMAQEIKKLPQFEDLTLDEINDFINEIYDAELADKTTAEDIYDAINKYKDKELIEFIANQDKITPPPTQVDTEDAYTFTSINEEKVTVHALNLCEKPDGSGDIIGSVPKDTVITVVSQCDQSYWYLVEYNGTKGYIHPDIYDAMKNREEVATYTFTEITGTDRAKRPVGETQVYSEPTKDSQVQDKINSDRVVSAQQKCNETGLVKVQYYSNTLQKLNYGWVDPAFLGDAVINNEQTPTPSPTPVQEDTTKPTETETTTPTDNKATPTPTPTATPTPKPSSTGHSASDKFYGSQSAEFTTADNKFTGTAIVDGKETEITGTIKIAGIVIAEGYTYEGSEVRIQIGSINDITDKQIDSIWAAYQYIYGTNNAHIDYTDETYTTYVIKLFFGRSEHTSGEGLELNTH